MPFTPTRKTVGFEPAGSIAGFPANPVPYELKPNEAFTKGDVVKFEYGKIVRADDSDTSGIVGVMAETVKQEDNPSDGLTYGLVYDSPFRIYRVTMDVPADCRKQGHDDSNANRLSVLVKDDETTDQTFRGALLYVYEGTNKGSIRTVSAMTGDGTDEVYTVTKAFPKRCDSTTKFIILGDDSAADRPVNVGTRVLLDDHKQVDAGGNPTSGPFLVRAIYPEDLMMDVVLRGAAHISG